MARQLEAVYEQGILRPLEPLVLAEHQRVRLTIEEKPAQLSWESGGPVNERHEELRWLARESCPYAGEWVALDGPDLVAHDEKLASVSAAAKKAGVAEPFFAPCPGTRTCRSAAGRACTNWNLRGFTTILVRMKAS